MNPQIVLASVLAVAFIGFVAYKIRIRSLDNELSSIPPLVDSSSLEEDLKDILAFVPAPEAIGIIESYMKYDAQIGDTVSFVDDQKRFIAKEFERMKEFQMVVGFLRENGLDVDGWRDRVRRWWKTSPRYERPEPSVANGGLTVMISRILGVVPVDELHELLRQKAKYSGSFSRLVKLLGSRDFRVLRERVEGNDVLHHHYFWAKEAGLEVTFAVELFNELHGYLTRTLMGGGRSL